MSNNSSKVHRVLIVDDHEVIRVGVIALLTNLENIEVCGEAWNAKDALRLVKLHRPDLAIIDISLKAGSGLEIAAEIREVSPKTKVVMYSSHDEALYADRSLRCGATGYVQKHEPAENLIAAVLTVLSGRIHLSESMTERLIFRAVQGESESRKTGSDPLSILSDRELEVFQLLGHGHTSAEIAERMNLKQKTVETYREKIKRKLELSNGNQLIQRASRWVLEQEPV